VDTLLPSLPTLLILRALDELPCHGYKIARWVDDKSRGLLSIKDGTLYPLLHQLEKRELIKGSWQKNGTEKAMKVYELTETGRNLLHEERDNWGKKIDAAQKVLFTRGLGNGLA
jgi:PadR family transcriptional regulator, regulatory protein PadR